MACVLIALLLAACYRPPGPAPGGSPSAILASQIAEIGRKSALLSAHSKDIDGAIDAWRGAAPDQRPAIEAQIRDRSAELAVEAAALQAAVRDVEEQARVWDP